MARNVTKSDKPQSHLYCSFCGKRSDEVKKLVAGPNCFICDECIDLSKEIIDAELPGMPARKKRVISLVTVNAPKIPAAGMEVIVLRFDGRSK